MKYLLMDLLSLETYLTSINHTDSALRQHCIPFPTRRPKQVCGQKLGPVLICILIVIEEI